MLSVLKLSVQSHKHLINICCTQTVHGRHSWGVKSHNAHSRPLQLSSKYTTLLQDAGWFLWENYHLLRELPSIEANIWSKKRKRVGLRDTLEKNSQGFSSWKQTELAVARGQDGGKQDRGTGGHVWGIAFRVQFGRDTVYVSGSREAWCWSVGWALRNFFILLRKL